jgi:radical SAM superfamily enzyme YgiQ (UPF0313 family)
VAYLAAVLEQHNHDVYIHDMNLETSTFPEADIYGVTCVSATFPLVHEIIKDLSQKNRTVIVGGIHPSIQPHDFDDLNCHLVIGEAEDRIVELIEMPMKPRVTDAGLVQDIDKLPFPARHLFKNVVDYSGIHGQEIWNGATSILSSRGCPYNCNFCTRIPQTRKMRFHSPDYMIRELKSVIAEYRIRHFRFIDDIFTLNKDRITTFCEKAVNEKLGINWMCITRGSMLGKDLLSKMRQAGCYEIDIGVESGSPRILTLMNKKDDIESLSNAVQLIKQSGIKVRAYLMYGFPGETEEDRQMTIEFVRKNKPDGVTVSKFIAMPGSKLWNNGCVTTQQWFYQDNDAVYQEFRKRVHEAGGQIRR